MKQNKQPTTTTPAEAKQKKKKNYYFTKEHEDAIVAYNRTSSRDERNRLYKIIQPALHELVEKIVFTYKFNKLANIEDLKNDCEVWLVTILDKYDPARQSKAFTYFSVVTKNWFIQQSKQLSRCMRNEVNHTTIEESGIINQLVVYNPYIERRTQHEFIVYLFEQMEQWEKDLKDDEVRVLHAIKVLFQQPETVLRFSKKAIYIDLRELSKLPPKRISTTVNKIRKKYHISRRRWLRDES